MASEAEKMRDVAQQLRKTASELDRERMLKVGHVIRASVGLQILRKKVGHHAG